jgi:hypothetical protein
MFEWLGRIGASLLGRTAYAIGVVSDYLNGLFEVLLNVLSSFFIYILGKSFEFLAYCIDQLPSFPDVLKSSTVNLPYFISLAYRLNVFFPVLELLIAVSFLFTFVSVFFTIKMILKLIPTIG